MLSRRGRSAPRNRRADTPSVRHSRASDPAPDRNRLIHRRLATRGRHVVVDHQPSRPTSSEVILASTYGPARGVEHLAGRDAATRQPSLQRALVSGQRSPTIDLPATAASPVARRDRTHRATPLRWVPSLVHALRAPVPVAESRGPADGAHVSRRPVVLHGAHSRVTPRSSRSPVRALAAVDGAPMAPRPRADSFRRTRGLSASAPDEYRRVMPSRVDQVPDEGPRADRLRDRQAWIAHARRDNDRIAAPIA